MWPRGLGLTMYEKDKAFTKGCQLTGVIEHSNGHYSTTATGAAFFNMCTTTCPVPLWGPGFSQVTGLGQS